MTAQETRQITQLTAEATPTHCNHTSVGTIVERGGKYLLFRRVKKPAGHAPSAGHVDELPYIGHPDEATIYAKAARRELQEEVGLEALRLDLVLEATTTFPCRRIGGTWHKWRIYRATVSPDAQPQGKADESRELTWYWPGELAQLAERTRDYLAGQVDEADWEARPGLEPVWLGFFNTLGILGDKESQELQPEAII